MEDTSIILRTDSYKPSQWVQYPDGTESVFSYIESRSDDVELVMFGLQPIIKLIAKQITLEDINRAQRFLMAHGVPFNRKGWEYILDKHQGYLPLLIRAVEEGKVIKSKNILVSVENTDKECFWLTSYVETLLLKVWYPITVASRSRECKQIIKKYLEETGDVAGLPFKLHDFGYRGVSSEESAAIGSAAHLVNFLGSDTIAGPLFLEKHYGATEMTAFSIPASEHSTITSWGRENEIEAYKNILTKFKDAPIVACVSDSYNIWKALDMWKELEGMISENQILVVRPDSGPVVRTAVECVIELGERFGYVKNDKGYKVLNKVRVIYGDGIDNPSVIRDILFRLKSHGYSADNIAFGMGGGLLQKCDRDTYKFAMKCSAIVRNVNGVLEEVEVFKDPITDPGKASKKGFLDLIKEDGEYKTVQRTNESLLKTELKIVYKDGRIYNEIHIDKVRENAAL